MTKENLEWEGLQPFLRNNFKPDTLEYKLGCIGCYFFSLAQYAGIKEPNLQFLSIVWKQAKNAGLIDENDEIIDKVTLLRLFGCDAEKVEVADSGQITRFYAFSGGGYHYCYENVDTETRRVRKIKDYRKITKRVQS